MTTVQNLNELKIRTDTEEGEPLKDFSLRDGDVSVYFRNLKRHLISHIRAAPIIVGSVAWLTEPDILVSLRNKKISIVSARLSADHKAAPTIHSL